MRQLRHSIVLLACLIAPATADVTVDLRAADPVAGLPVISASRTNFMRAYRRWRTNCKQPDVFVEDGAILFDGSPQYSYAQLIGGCEPIDKYAGNVGAINASMKSAQCSTAAIRGQLVTAVPASFEAAGMRVDVSATATSAHVTIDRFAVNGWTGDRRVTIGMPVFEVRGWYMVEASGRRQLALLLAGKQADGTIVERWIEVWASRLRLRGPIDVARTWLLALAVKDRGVLGRTSVVPFEQVGMGTECAARATKDAELGPLLDCVSKTGARYAPLYDELEFSTIAATKIPAGLATSAPRIAELAKTGHTLIQFETDDATQVFAMVLAVRAGKVAAVFEHVRPK
jgi:hypothetical protein